MAFWKQTEIIDYFGFLAGCTAFGELRTVTPIRLAGGTLTNVANSLFYTQTLVGSATITNGSGRVAIATGITANSSAILQTVAIGRFVGQLANAYASVIQMGDLGDVNNVRRFGAFNGTDGCYFKLAGTTFSVCTMIGGVETAIPFGSWNGNPVNFTLTNYNTFVIEYVYGAVFFAINRVLVHSAIFQSSPWSTTLNLPVREDNTNSGGSTTNAVMNVQASVIERLGIWETQGRFFNLTAAGTTVLKSSPGALHRVVINNPASSSSTIILYDNTSASGTVIAAIQGPAQANPITLDYDLPFDIGLVAVSTGTWSATIVYE